MKFIFNCEPKAVQSVRVAKRGNFVQKYQPKANLEYKNWLKWQAMNQLPENFKLITNPIKIIRCFFVFTPPKSFPKYKLKEIEDGVLYYKTTRPDLGDNLMKATLDALTGTVWKDDSQICHIEKTMKRYGPTSGIVLEIEEIKR